MPQRKRKDRPLPSPHHEVSKLVKRGDLQGLINAFVLDNHFLTTADEKTAFIHECLNNAAREETLLETTLQAMLVFTAELHTRCEITLKRQIRQCDRRNGANFAELGGEAFNEQMKRLAALQDRIVTLTKAMATVKHTLALSEQPRCVPLATSPRVIRIDEQKDDHVRANA